MKRIRKDITTVERGIICHQANAQGVMGAGLAAQIRMKFPRAYNDYRELYDSGKLKLGQCIVSQVGDELYVASLVGQDNFGRGARFTLYNALSVALIQLNKFRDDIGRDLPVYIPYRMGSGLGGGSWRIVKDIVEEFHKDAIICQI
jgi:O-acetyl-ADP-ribose deacetylase (regulator of RNase III)